MDGGVAVDLGSLKWSKRAQNTQIQCIGDPGQPRSMFKGVGVPKGKRRSLMRVNQLMFDQNEGSMCI